MEAWKASYDYALQYLSILPELKVDATDDLETLRSKINHPLAAYGMRAEDVIKQLIDDCKDGIVHSVSARFFGWVKMAKEVKL